MTAREYNSTLMTWGCFVDSHIKVPSSSIIGRKIQALDLSKIFEAKYFTSLIQYSTYWVALRHFLSVLGIV